MSRSSATGRSRDIGMDRDLLLCPTCGFLAGSVHVDAGDPASTLLVPVRLTQKEQTIFEMIRNGLTNDEIASRLFITRNTVKYHLKQVYRKLGIRSRRRWATGVKKSPLASRPLHHSSIVHRSSGCQV